MVSDCIVTLTFTSDLHLREQILGIWGFRSWARALPLVSCLIPLPLSCYLEPWGASDTLMGEQYLPFFNFALFSVTLGSGMVELKRKKKKASAFQ